MRQLLSLASGLYTDVAQLQAEFLRWHNTYLQAGTLEPCDSQMADYAVGSNGKRFVVSLLVCKNDVDAGEPLVQAWRQYQLLYEDGKCWASHPTYQLDPLPALVLLLEGPRLSIHALWTLYNNRVAYAPLTPSYYLANEWRDTANLWKVMDVLAAYEKAAQGLRGVYEARCRLDFVAVAHAAQLRVDAQLAPGACGIPVTLPYSLLDESLGLSDISFVGPGLLYQARQRVAVGQERRVLVKFVEGRYGDKVHSAWYGAGVAPALHSALPVGGSAFIMVVMELLAEEDSWVPLRKALARGGGEPLKQAVRSALEAAHAAHVPEDNAVAAHGDVCCDNTFVRGRGGSASGEYDVRFTGFEWAGPEGKATYPLVPLTPSVPWHEDVRPGAVMRQEHDRHLLDADMQQARTAADWSAIGPLGAFYF